MNALLGLIAIAGLAGVIISLIALIRPLPKLKLTTRRRAGLALACSLAALVVVGALSPSDPSVSSGEEIAQGPSRPAKSAAYVVGQPIDVGDFRIVIRSVSERSAVGSSFMREQASAGGVLVVVDYTVENISERPKASYELPALGLVGPNDVVYDRDIGKTVAYVTEADLDSKAMSDLNPGIRVSDAVVFEVSKASFDPATWVLGLGAGKRVRVAINSGDGEGASQLE